MSDQRLSKHMDSLRRVLIGCRRATRAELAAQTGLSAMTVGKLLARMQARGEVSQNETVASGGGRPSTVAQYNADFAHFACVSVMQKERRNAFVFSAFDALGQRVFSQTRDIDPVREDSFDFFFEEARAAGMPIRLVVFALPGEAQGDRIVISDFEGLLGERFLPRIRERFGVRTIFENDVNAAVYGQAFSGEQPEICAGIYFPGRFPPGAGAVVHGRVLRGHRNFAGEVAYIHGAEAWNAADAGEEDKLTERIGLLLRAYACTLAPQRMVLYGDMFSPDMQDRIRREFAAHFGACFDMDIRFSTALCEDMEKGAARLGYDALLTLLGEPDA